jgi:hypothetical protein
MKMRCEEREDAAKKSAEGREDAKVGPAARRPPCRHAAGSLGLSPSRSEPVSRVAESLAPHLPPASDDGTQPSEAAGGVRLRRCAPRACGGGGGPGGGGGDPATPPLPGWERLGLESESSESESH